MEVVTNTDAIDLFQTIFYRRLGGIKDHTDFMELIKLIAYIQNDIRFHLLTSDSQIDDLWDEIRENTFNVDFLLNLTSEFKFHLPEHMFDRVSTKIASAYSINYGSSSIDDDLLERLVSEDVMHKHAATNAWFVSVMLISFLASIADVGTILDIPPKSVAESRND